MHTSRPAILAALLLLASAAGAQPALLTLVGPSSHEEFSRALTGVGDFDGDGVPDLAVGSPSADDLVVDGGRATVFSGADGAALLTVIGDVADARLGGALAGPGDVDGDGVPDLLLATGREFGPASRAQMHAGSDGALLWSLSDAGDHLGTGASVAAVGDFDGDGVPDVAVGAPDSFAETLPKAGSVRVLSGDTGQLLLEVFGSTSGHRLGTAVAAAGDVDLDGVPDLVVGGHSVAHLMSGVDGAVLQTKVDTSGTRFGWVVDGGHDVNGDGVPDWAAGGPGPPYSHDALGVARVYSGQGGALLWSRGSDQPGDRFGGALAFVGDVDGDGHADLAVGSSEAFDGPGLGQFGRVQTFALPSQNFIGLLDSPYGDHLGTCLAAIGDVDGDGLTDLAASGWLYDPPGLSNAGRVLLLPADLRTVGPGPVYEVGFGLAGSLGIPQLVAVATLLPGSQVWLTLVGAPPGATAWLVLGLDWLGAPFKGGVLVPRPDLALPYSVPLSPLPLSISTTWPAGVPSGAELVMQMWIADGAAPAGFSASNGLRFVAP